jgi:hypothetical protein
MTIDNIADNVQTILENMSDPEFVDVLDHPQEENAQFNGYPSVSHFYERTESNYATVSQNRRVINYLIFVYVVTPEDEGAILRRTYNIVDKIVQRFDETTDLSDSELNLSRACDIMRPVPGEMGKITTDKGTGYLAEIRLFCEADVTFR